MRFITALIAALAMAPAFAELDWDSALGGAQRSEQNRARDAFRHPRETLEFFGLEEGMTVVELSPGGGWYTEILAPLLKENGALYAAHYSPNASQYYRRALGGYLQKLGNDDLYADVTVTVFAPPGEVDLAPAESADLVLAFRNVHSWMRGDALPVAFAAIHAALKPGGVFGVVQHRASDTRDAAAMAESGYVTEEYVIAAARDAGFVLDAKSEINANPRDPTDHAGGVWALPPSLRGAQDDADRAARLAIGESDRMTLRFLKPAG